MKTALNNVLLPPLLKLSTIFFDIVTANCTLVRLNNLFSIVDNIEQSWQQNIVQSCFHQPNQVVHFWLSTAWTEKFKASRIYRLKTVEIFLIFLSVGGGNLLLIMDTAFYLANSLMKNTQ